MKNIALIPARLGSSRFPGKPLVKILGKPLIQHVWEGTLKSKLIDTPEDIKVVENFILQLNKN